MVASPLTSSASVRTPQRSVGSSANVPRPTPAGGGRGTFAGKGIAAHRPTNLAAAALGKLPRFMLATRRGKEPKKTAPRKAPFS
jgi:hypothetical protein